MTTLLPEQLPPPATFPASLLIRGHFLPGPKPPPAIRSRQAEHVDISERGQHQGDPGPEQGQAPRGDPRWGLLLLAMEESQALLCGDQGGDFRREMLVAESHFIFLTAGSLRLLAFLE